MICLDRQIGKEREVGLEAEEVDGVATSLKERVVLLLNQTFRVVEEGLRVHRVGVEVKRQNALVKHCVQPESSFFVEYHLKDPDQDL